MARLNGARLQMLEKGEDKVVREIPVRTSQVQIGNNPIQNTIRLNSAGVEDVHCKIFVQNDKVFIANFSAKNPISIDQTVVPKRAALTDGSVLEICGTRFRWKFDDSKLVRKTPTSSKFGNRRRTTMVRKKQPAAAAASGGASSAVAGGSGKKPASKKSLQQKPATYTLPKNNKQLLKNIRKRLTVHNIMTRHNSEDDADEEEDTECEESDNVVEHSDRAESPKPATPEKQSSAAASAANTPFYTPEPEKENSVPVTKTPKTPMLQLENSAMMILSYTPAIGSRSKANIQKTPISGAKSGQRLNYLTPKNENVSVSGTPQKSKAGNSMYLIDLTTPTSGHSSFVCSPMLDTTASSVGTPKVGLIDLTTPSPKKVKTPASALKSTQQKTLLKSALKNASRTPRTALRGNWNARDSQSDSKISLNDTPTRSATSTRSNKTPASGSARAVSIRSRLETPISSKKQPDPDRKEPAPSTPTAVQTDQTKPKATPIMTTDELFDTLVGRQSVAKTYERKSTSPKKTPCPLVLAEDTSDMPKTDIDLWVESVVAAVTSPEPVNMDSIIRKPNRTTQVRSSQYSDITPHESFAEGSATASTSEVVDPQTENVAADVDSPDELDNMTDKPTIPNSSRRSETPLASKIARSLGNKRQTIGNFFTNIFGKLTVSPVTRISIADDSINQSGEEEERANDDDSDGSEEVYHDSETSHAADVAAEQPSESIASSPKLRQSLRDTRKFIGNAWTSLNTSRPQLDNTAEIDESLLLSDTYNESQSDAGNESDAVYDLTDLGSRPATAQPPMSAAKTPTHRQSVQSAGAFDISPLATPLCHDDDDAVPQELISPNQSINETQVGTSESVSVAMDQSVPAEGETEELNKANAEEQEAHLDTSEMEPLEVTDGFESELEIGQPKTPRTNDLVGSRRATRNSIATTQVFTPKAAAATSSEIAPLSESKLPLRGLHTVAVQSPAKTPQKYESVPDIELLEDANADHVDQSAIDSFVEVEAESAVEQLVECDKSSSLCVDQVEIANAEIAENVAPLEETVECTVETVEQEQLPNSSATLEQTVVNDSLNLNAAARRSMRKSLATMTATPKTNASLSKVPMSESKLPLRRLRAVQTAELEQTVEKTPVNQESALEETAEPQAGESPTDQSANSTPVTPIPASPGRSSRRSARSTPQKASSSSTLKPTPVGTTPLLKRVLQKVVKASATKAAQTPKPALNESDADASLQLDQLYQTPPSLRVTRGKATNTSTPNVADASLNLDELYKTPARGNAATPASAKSRAAKVENLQGTSEQASLDPSVYKLESSAADKSLNLQELYKTPAEALPNQLLEVAETREESAARMAEADMSLNLQQMYQTPVRTAKSDESHEESGDLAIASESVADADLGGVKLIETTEPRENVDMSLNLHELYKTPGKSLLTNAQQSAVENLESPKEGAVQADVSQLSAEEADASKIVQVEKSQPNAEMSLNLQEMYKTPARSTRQSSAVKTTPQSPVNVSNVDVDEEQLPPSADTTHNESAVKNSEQPNVSFVQADVSLNLQQLHKTPARPTVQSSVANRTLQSSVDATCDDAVAIVSTPDAVVDHDVSKAEADEVGEPQPSADITLNLQELYKTPARSQREDIPMSSAVKNAATPQKLDVCLNLQSAARPTHQSSALIGSPQSAAGVSKSDEVDKPQTNADMSLNLQDMYKTPARSTHQTSAVKSTPQSPVDVDEELQPSADITHNESAVKNLETPERDDVQADVSAVTANVSQSHKKPQPNEDMTLNLQELYKTPARAPRTVAQKSETPKESVVQADVSLNLQQLYKTPARSTRQSSAVKSTPNADASKVDMSLNLQELYKTPARTLRGVAQLTPAAGMATPAIVAVQPEPEANVSLSLEQLYKTPARTHRESSDPPSAMKQVMASEVTPQKIVEKSAVDVTPTAEMKKVERTPIAGVSEPETDMTLNLDQMYQTPARQTTSDNKTVGKVEADKSLNLDQLYKTPAQTLRGVTQLASVQANTPATEPKAEAEVSLNLQELYKTPTRTLRGTKAPQSASKRAEVAGTPKQDSADMSLNLQNLYKTPVQTQPPVADTTFQAAVCDESNLKVESLFKTPARTTRALLPRSSAKVATPTPKRTPRSANKIHEQPSVSMVESELASSIAGESMDMGSESDGLVTGKAISSTPFNPRTRKSTLVAAVGMMSPLNSSGDSTMTSEMNTEAIGITTIDSTTVDQMQTLDGVFVAAQSRLVYDESGLETIAGDPLQVTNAVEDITCAVEVNETTQRTVAGSLLEQSETLIEPSCSEQETVDASKIVEQSLVSTSAADGVEEPVQSALLETEVITPATSLREVLQSPGNAETPGNKSAMESTPVRNVVETLTPVVEPDLEAVKKTPVASPKCPSTPANKPTSGTPIRTSTRYQRPVYQDADVTVNVSISEQELVTVSTLPETPEVEAAPEEDEVTPDVPDKVETVESIAEEKVDEAPIDNMPSEKTFVSSPVVTETVPDVSPVDEPADASTLLSEKMDAELVPEQSVDDLSAVPEISPVTTTQVPDTAAAAYLTSMGVDPALLQHIHERVDTLERELAEMNDITQSSSTFLERSDEQSLDSQESEVEGSKNQTPKPMKRRLYTKIAPDESTPERRESIGDQRVSSFYTESESDRRAVDTSSEIEEPKKVDSVKVLPSRASRRKIISLSEEALAGASPELKFVKPKQPKVVAPVEDPPQIDTSVNTSETEQSDQETSLGRRKVVFNDHIQVKEINSPAFIGEIIKKTALRGRGRNNKQQPVTVTVDQHAGQAIKPATKRAKIAEPVTEDASPQEGTSTVKVTEGDLDKVETVAPVVEEPLTKSEEIVEASVEKPAAKRSRAKKVPATKRTGSRTKIPVEAAAEDSVELDPQEGISTIAVTDDVLGKVEPVVEGEVIPKNVEGPPKHSEGIVEASVDEPAPKRSRTKKAPATKRTGSRPKLVVEAVAEDKDEAAPKEGTIPNEIETVESVVEEQPKPSDEIVDAPVEEPATKRIRTKKAPVSKRVVSRTKSPVESAVRDKVEAAPEEDEVTPDVPDKVETVESVAEEKVDEPSEQSEEIAEAHVDNTHKPSRSKKALATKRAVSKTKDEQTSTAANEDKHDESDAASVQPSAKRSRRGAKEASDGTEPVVKEPTDKEEKIEPEQKVKAETTVEGSEGQTHVAEKRDAEQPKATTKAPSRSRRGKKQASESEESPVEAQETAQAAKPKSRRGGKKNDTSADEVVQTDTPSEAAETSSAVAEQKTDTEVEKSIEKAPQIEGETSKAKANPRSRRGAKGKRAPADEADPKPSHELTSSADSHEDENSASHSKAAVKKGTRRGRGATQNDTVESSVLPEVSAGASLTVEKAVADSTSHDEPSAAAVDVVSGAKRSRRGATKEDAESAANEPLSKRTRRAPKSKVEQVTEEGDSAVAADLVVAKPKPIGRSRRGQNQDSEAESAKTQDEQPEIGSEKQEASQIDKFDIEEKPSSRRGARKKPAEEQTSARMPSPTLPPPAVDEQPAKRVGRQAAKRAPKNTTSNPDPVPVEMSMNESHMVKTMLPASHTSTPLIKSVLNADAVEVPSATRGRRAAAANPVIAALIEESTPRTRARRGASATPEVRVETPSTPAKRGRGRGAAAKTKVVEEETQSTVTEAPQASTTAVDESSEPSTSTARSRGKKPAKVDKEVVEEATEPEPATKRSRKVSAKLRDDADDAPKAPAARGRRGAKAKTEGSNADDEAGPSEEVPKKKPRGAAATKRTAKKTAAADLNEESVPEEEETEEEEAPKSPPPKRTRKGAR
ncbi:LOW QUALITY PROTEIN: proliferation marker protein Ki-67 [Culex quinquefasciatus]|uniref:LOW QUALITY PROTEIN: proliferation marker protein Ki-67 n=1 Tax=Culex quinquefasciatus TaxID=7176 RepID=UPI0018E38BBC|nr:LOW QUALITY PROTEIN: proliferation marker protein Ki-67 [Culex quinquefasciatus]